MWEKKKKKQRIMNNERDVGKIAKVWKKLINLAFVLLNRLITQFLEIIWIEEIGLLSASYSVIYL